MKLSISNIAWDSAVDDEMFEYLKYMDFEGLEIAPTRLEPNDPYNNISESVKKTKYIEDKYNLKISSMQSIWFGRTENIFASEEDRDILIAYTNKAIDYAKAIGCRNLVFGSPRNRVIDDFKKYNIAIEFFRKLGEYAEQNEVAIAFEPNPAIYNTNFINYTTDAIKLVKEVASKGFMVNLDLGTVIWYKEDLNSILTDIDIINHIHISEPYLAQIKTREIHKKLKYLLHENGYCNFVSIEMKNLNDINKVKETVKYVNGVMK